MNGTGLGILAAIGFLGASTDSMASFISLRTETTLAVSNREAGLVLRITNLGDEPAKAVQVETRLEARTSLSTAKDSLGPDETMQLEQSLGEIPERPGTYAVVVRTYYADANGYPFSALSVLALPNGSNHPELLAVGAAPVSLSKEGVLSLVLRTASQASLDARVRLVLPNEIGGEAPETNLVILPGQSRVAEFRIKNLSARPGSTYPVFAVTEYEADGEHHTVMASALVSIESPHVILRDYRLWMAVAAVLLGVFLVVQVADKLRSREKRA